jgi:hypothetical protein
MNDRQIWYLAQNGKKSGPFTAATLKGIGEAGHVTAGMLVWKEGLANWAPVESVKGLKITPLPAAPPEVPVAVAVVTAAPQVVAGHVTIEKTGKALKGHLALAYMTVIGGFVMAGIMAGTANGSPDPNSGIAICAAGAGMMWVVVTKVRIWWNHG